MATTIDTRFLAAHQRSAALHEEARALLPGGVTHDIRHFEPFPIYVERAQGPRKWDVDSNEILDFVMGHGALLFGHAHPLLVQAVGEQIARGTHYGASHAREIEWARRIVDLVPSAAKVRFVSSGTEATMMAARLARAATGRTRILKLRHHFHGWNDSFAIGLQTSLEHGRPPTGLPPEMIDAVTIVGQHDTAIITQALRSGQYAAAICEPGGAHWGGAPLHPDVLTLLRHETERAGTVLIFDEVVTGFRLAPGGVQQLAGLTPDLTTMAKVVAGGLPGGAVAGRAALIDQIAIPPSGAEPPGKRIAHPGTFNANPLSAAAGVAALRAIAAGGPLEAANAAGDRLCAGLNHALRRAEVPGAAYNQGSLVHIVLGRDLPPPPNGVGWHWQAAGRLNDAPHTPDHIAWAFRRSLLTHGVDLIGMGAIVSAVHTDADIDRALDACQAALADLRREAIL